MLSEVPQLLEVVEFDRRVHFSRHICSGTWKSSALFSRRLKDLK